MGLGRWLSEKSTYCTNVRTRVRTFQKWQSWAWYPVSVILKLLERKEKLRQTNACRVMGQVGRRRGPKHEAVSDLHTRIMHAYTDINIHTPICTHMHTHRKKERERACIKTDPVSPICLVIVLCPVIPIAKNYAKLLYAFQPRLPRRVSRNTTVK